MPHLIKIEADVVDVAQDVPRREDVFFIDTNVWFSLFDPTSLTNRPEQAYPRYFKSLRKAKSAMFYCGLSMAELAHIIERKRCGLFETQQGMQEGTLLKNIKDFRHNYPDEREEVVRQLQAAWEYVKQAAKPMDITIGDALTNAALERFSRHPLDGYDLFYLEAMKASSITKILTHDGDFAGVPGIQLFTANPRVLQQAQQQRKLLRR